MTESPPLTDDEKFFRDLIYRQLGWGFALIFVEATIILNPAIHFSIEGRPPAGREELFHPDRAQVVIEQTKIVICFMTLFTVGWVFRSTQVRLRLPHHPTIPSWPMVGIGTIFIVASQIFIIGKVAGVPLLEIPGRFFAASPAGVPGG